jgi:proteasome lid subunit RPN8/RPN11
MVAQAHAELPNECCGILAGRIEGDVGIVEQRYPLVNESASRREYCSEPQSLFAAFKDWRARGLEHLATYHSHPTSAPIPSRTDLERNAYGPEVIDLIISLQNAEPLVRAWRLTNSEYWEAGWEVAS